MTATKHNDPRHPHKPDCFGCKVSGFGIGAKVLITRNPGLVNRQQTEKDYSKNLPAYTRQRKAGLQPKSFTKAAEVESRAVSKWEVETGHDFHGDSKKGARADELQHAIKTGQEIDL